MAGRFSVEAVFTARDHLTRIVGRMESRVSRFSMRSAVGLQRLDRRLSSVHQGFRRAALGFGAAGAAAGLALNNIRAAGADFEQGMANVGAVMLKRRSEIQRLESAAINLGKTTRYTATEAAAAMEIMARSGFSEDDILGGIRGVLDAAAASGLEIAEVADHVSNALKGFGEDTSKAGMIADVLALASARTNSTIGTLGESLRNVASTARELKVPFHEAVAGVALLQDVGLDASVAGSALNTMLTKLAKPPAELARKMRRMGISFKKANGDMKSFPEVLAAINEGATRAGGNFDRVAFLADLVGLRGQKAASNLAKLFESGKFSELAAELEDATGKAAEMAELRMDSATGDWLLFGSAVDGVKQRLYNLRTGPLRETIQGMTTWVQLNEDLIVSRVSEFLTELAARKSDIVKWLKRIGTGLAVFYTLSAAVKVARVAIAALEITLKAVAAAKWLWVAATKAATLAQGRLTAGTMAHAAASRTATVAQASYNGALSAWTAQANAGTVAAGGFAGKINGITSKLGRAGLLGGALAVGVAIGTWLDHEFQISSMFSKWLAQLTGVNRELDRAGGRAATRGTGAGGRVYADDTDETGASTAPGAQGTSSRARQRVQVIGPEHAVARSVSESFSTEREQVDITVRDETGRAEIRGGGSSRRARVRLRPSGAF